jgi:hypothetical protein
VNNVAVHTPSPRLWWQTLSARFAPAPGDSALVCGVIARGRRTLHHVVVLTPLPQLWLDDEDEDDDEDTECQHRDVPALELT